MDAGGAERVGRECGRDEHAEEFVQFEDRVRVEGCRTFKDDSKTSESLGGRFGRRGKERSR